MRATGEYLFTSESVSEGHPDKVADRLSDTVLDAYLAADPYARVACETLVTTNQVVLAGETRGPESVTHEYLSHLARLAIQDIGYDQAGFSWRNARIDVLLHTPVGRHRARRGCAGQQGRGRGRPGHHVRLCLPRDRGADAGAALLRASDPAPDQRAAPRRDRAVAGLLPDAKSQVTLRYIDGKPVGATSVVVSTQHEEDAEPGAGEGPALADRGDGAAARLDARRIGSSMSTRRASS